MTYLEQTLGDLAARETSRELDEHVKYCPVCLTEPFGYCLEALKIITKVGQPERN